MHMRGLSRRASSLALSLTMVVTLVPVAAAQDITMIHAIQGTGASSPLVGSDVTIEGVVVADLQGPGGWRGFYVQEEDSDADADPLTSEGIFVFDSDAPDVAVGDVVTISGRVGEFSGQTQLSSVSAITVGTNDLGLVTPTSVQLPVTAVSDLERFEGMSVVFPQDLYITEYFNYDRFGEMVLATSRQYQGTHVAQPGAAANAVTAANALARITLDDGLDTQNPSVLRHPNGEAFTLDNRFRGGDILQGVQGVLGYAFGRYRIHPTDGATHVEANPRPVAPDPIDGDLRVASFNVLNFFTNIDDGPDTCGPTGNLDCRGADTEAEYQRQLDKLLAGILALDADVVGIQEIENDVRTDDGNRAHDAVLTLVEELNAIDGPGAWAWAGDAGHYNNYPVRNEIIYRPATVTPMGSPIALADDAFDATRPGEIEPLGRPPLAQTFRSNLGGSRQPFTVVVNHFKSKGSSCASIGDPDTGDGQGNCNLTRVAQSHALLDFIAELEEDVSGVLVVGDLNSYAQEDPITTLESGGLIDLVERYEGAAAYSYVFDGQLGYLDTALATRSMSNWVEGLTVFHINADEPDVLDYDMSFKPPSQDVLYEPNAYRSSDHDPVIVGITFGQGRSR
jgi:hypothetical protein